jgi:ABC-type bacteriocin/lantibiotic exporter with double-glycine peptidase domain
MVERNSPKIQDAVSATEIFPMNRALNLVNVKFAYRDRSTPVLQGVNMEIKQGQWVGIVGGTGCGKSSLLDLVIGLLAPSEGHLEVDGKKIVPKEYLIWKNNFSLVPQHVFLLDGSITDNIKFFSSKKYSNDIVRTASSLALVDEFAVGLPQGFETRVGERGAMLSGGQRQRIGIARALARQTPFLVLDEATNALDERTEKCLLENLRRFAMGKTVLVISHHPRALAFCDAVYEICDGKAHLRSKPHCTSKST